MKNSEVNKKEEEKLCLPKKDATTSEQSISSLMSTASISQDENFRVLKHAENSLQCMKEYLHNKLLTDVVLIAGGKRFPAHRLVLSASSEYFAAMFTSSLRESSQSEVELIKVDPDALWALIEYCYTGSIELREDCVETLLATARILQIDSVVKACCQFLIKQLHPSNCLGIRMFADTQGCSHLLSVAHNYTTEHFMEVMSSQEFLLLSADDVAKLLESDDLNIPSEEIVFQALINWLEYDLENRRKDASLLLSFVRLPLLSPVFIADNIDENEIFKNEKRAQELVMEALKYHLLPERRPLLQSSRTKPRKATVGHLLAIGGMDENKGATSIDAFSLCDNTWKYLASTNGRRLQFGAAVVDSKLIIVGGRDGLKTLDSVERLDFSTLKWSRLPSINTHRHGLGVAVLGGPLYAVGGHDGWSFLQTVERWDPNNEEWSFIAPMPGPRTTVGVAVLNDKLYAVGGRDQNSCLNTVDCYDPHTNKWTSCAPMSKRRGGVGVGVANGCIYALGGYDLASRGSHACRYDSVERYDPKTDTWTMVAPMSVARDAVGVCLLGDQLFAVGGYDGQQYLTLVETYDPIINEWHQVAPLRTGRAGPCVIMKDPIG
ncbi:kelch-like protein 5 isoform X2 [Chelonus insularis]|uniref:kelch-like protein 5 isoform X2 n=1 Tax=Chelonus insularis TaxID=460826 RepID=UPI00158D8FE6|nr:kelch-like protein 5 isoform X2 [Chelonus insularis]